MKVSLKALRVNAELTQEDVAKELGVSVDTVKNIEAGKRELRVSELKTVCALYGCTFDDIFMPEGYAKSESASA